MRRKEKEINIPFIRGKKIFQCKMDAEGDVYDLLVF